jgi:hypothetical protein
VKEGLVASNVPALELVLVNYPFCVSQDYYTHLLSSDVVRASRKHDKGREARLYCS